MLRERLPSPTVLMRQSDGEPENAPTRASVLDRLADTDIAHFSCHGSSHPTDPSRSLLLLADHRERPFAVTSLIPVRLPRAQLVFLSACETARNTAADLLDESIHLASAFQLAGYPHVIGTPCGRSTTRSRSMSRGPATVAWQPNREPSTCPAARAPCISPSGIFAISRTSRPLRPDGPPTSTRARDRSRHKSAARARMRG